ncbi:Zinc finger protein 39 [Schistosoma japonicum]|nr:Zinc finger protein 39 [Schistosoma japonicum]
MLMNLNNFIGTIMPKTSTPTKELTRTDYIDDSSDHGINKSDLLNSHRNSMSPDVSPKRHTINNNSNKRSFLKDNVETETFVENKSNDECDNKTINSPMKYTNAEGLQGYTLVNNRDNLEKNGLKMRLLTTLADMIPHDESLSLRLLMSYTIDDQESECVVIDETLCRGGKHNETIHRNRNLPHQSPKETEMYEVLQDDVKHKSSNISVESSTSTQQNNMYEADALDLSLHNEISDSMVSHVDPLGTTSTKQGDKSHETVNSALNDTKTSTVNTCCIPLRLLSPNQGQFSLNATKALEAVMETTSITNPTNQIPLLDTSILALLPLLQQQQQYQQLQQSQSCANNLTYQDVLNPSSLSLLSAAIPNAATTINTIKSNPVTFNYAGTSTNANLLFNQLYPAKLQQDIQQTNNLLTTHLSNILPKQIETTRGVAASTSNTITSSLINNIVNSQSLLNTASVIGFPLLNPFSLNTTSSNSITNNQNNIDQFNAFLSSTALLGTTSASTFSQALLTQPSSALSISPSTITPINLGSTNTTTTLVNLKDNQTGLIETVGIMQGMKNISQPIASLINQLTINASSTNNNTISFKPLSTLSQLFNSTLPATVSTHGTNNNNFTTTANSNKTNNLTIPTIINASNSNNHISLINGINNDNELTKMEKYHIKLSSSSSKSSYRSSPVHSSHGQSVGKLSKLNSTKDHKNEHIKSSIQQNQQSNSTTATNSNFLFGRRLVLSRRFICNQCRRNFSSLAELNRHTIETHNSFRCTICSAHFTQRSNLQRHSLKHVGFKPFTCNLCKKEYYRKDHLVRHIEVTHPTHDPKMNITVHLTSSECLDYLDRLQAGKQSQSPLSHSSQLDNKDVTRTLNSDITTFTTCSNVTTTISMGSSITNCSPSDTYNKNMIYKDDLDLMNEESMRIEEAKIETPDTEMSGNDNGIQKSNIDVDTEEQYYNMTDCSDVR